MNSHILSLICTQQRLYHHHLYFYYYYVGGMDKEMIKKDANTMTEEEMKVRTVVMKLMKNHLTCTVIKYKAHSKN